MASAEGIHILSAGSYEAEESLPWQASPGRRKADGADVFSSEQCWSQSVCQSNTWGRNELHLCFNHDSKTIQGSCQSCTFPWSTRDRNESGDSHIQDRLQTKKQERCRLWTESTTVPLPKIVVLCCGARCCVPSLRQFYYNWRSCVGKEKTRYRKEFVKIFWLPNKMKIFINIWIYACIL